MTVDSTQRILFDVPSPWTSISIGQFTPARDDGVNVNTAHYSGIGVYTDADVRFNALGPAAQSDLIAQAKDQLWLQAVGNVVGVAGESALIASPAATYVAGQGGVTILAGFAPSDIATQTEAGTMPEAVSGYASTAAIPTVVFGIFDTIMAVGLTALDAYLTITDRPTGSSRLSAFNRWGLQGSLANLAGATLNIAGLTGFPYIPLPGINMFAQAGILVGSALGGVNIIGVPGLLIQSTFTTQFALIASGVRGLKSAGMTSLVSADVSALTDVTVRGSSEVVLASRTGTTTLRGLNMNLGILFPIAVLGVPTPQLPTASVKIQATQEVSLRSWAGVDIDAHADIGLKAGKELTVDGGKKVSFKVGVFEISLDDTRTQLGSPAGAKAKFEGSRGAKKVLISGPGDTASARLMGTRIKLEAAAGCCSFDIMGKKLTVDGTFFDIK